LNDHLKKCGKFGLVMAVMVLPAFVSLPEDVPDLNQLSEQLRDKTEGPQIELITDATFAKYEKRMLGVIEDLYNFGYI
jgi:hypothetical protein